MNACGGLLCLFVVLLASVHAAVQTRTKQSTAHPIRDPASVYHLSYQFATLDESKKLAYDPELSMLTLVDAALASPCLSSWRFGKSSSGADYIVRPSYAPELVLAASVPLKYESGIAPLSIPLTIESSAYAGRPIRGQVTDGVGRIIARGFNSIQDTSYTDGFVFKLAYTTLGQNYDMVPVNVTDPILGDVFETMHLVKTTTEEPIWLRLVEQPMALTMPPPILGGVLSLSVIGSLTGTSQIIHLTADQIETEGLSSVPFNLLPASNVVMDTPTLDFQITSHREGVIHTKLERNNQGSGDAASVPILASIEWPDLTVTTALLSGSTMQHVKILGTPDTLDINVRFRRCDIGMAGLAQNSVVGIDGQTEMDAVDPTLLMHMKRAPTSRPNQHLYKFVLNAASDSDPNSDGLASIVTGEGRYQPIAGLITALSDTAPTGNTNGMLNTAFGVQSMSGAGHTFILGGMGLQATDSLSDDKLVTSPLHAKTRAGSPRLEPLSFTATNFGTFIPQSVQYVSARMSLKPTVDSNKFALCSQLLATANNAACLKTDVAPDLLFSAMSPDDATGIMLIGRPMPFAPVLLSARYDGLKLISTRFSDSTGRPITPIVEGGPVNAVYSYNVKHEFVVQYARQFPHDQPLFFTDSRSDSNWATPVVRIRWVADPLAFVCANWDDFAQSWSLVLMRGEDDDMDIFDKMVCGWRMQNRASFGKESEFHGVNMRTGKKVDLRLIVDSNPFKVAAVPSASSNNQNRMIKLRFRMREADSIQARRQITAAAADSTTMTRADIAHADLFYMSVAESPLLNDLVTHGLGIRSGRSAQSEFLNVGTRVSYNWDSDCWKNGSCSTTQLSLYERLPSGAPTSTLDKYEALANQGATFAHQPFAHTSNVIKDFSQFSSTGMWLLNSDDNLNGVEPDYIRVHGGTSAVLFDNATNVPHTIIYAAYFDDGSVQFALSDEPMPVPELFFARVRSSERRIMEGMMAGLFVMLDDASDVSWKFNIRGYDSNGDRLFDLKHDNTTIADFKAGVEPVFDTANPSTGLEQRTAFRSISACAACLLIGDGVGALYLSPSSFDSEYTPRVTFNAPVHTPFLATYNRTLNTTAFLAFMNQTTVVYPGLLSSTADPALKILRFSTTMQAAIFGLERAPTLRPNSDTCAIPGLNDYNPVAPLSRQQLSLCTQSLGDSLRRVLPFQIRTGIRNDNRLLGFGMSNGATGMELGVHTDTAFLQQEMTTFRVLDFDLDGVVAVKLPHLKPQFLRVRSVDDSGNYAVHNDTARWKLTMDSDASLATRFFFLMAPGTNSPDSGFAICFDSSLAPDVADTLEKRQCLQWGSDNRVSFASYNSALGFFVSPSSELYKMMWRFDAASAAAASVHTGVPLFGLHSRALIQSMALPTLFVDASNAAQYMPHKALPLSLLSTRMRYYVTPNLEPVDYLVADWFRSASWQTTFSPVQHAVPQSGQEALDALDLSVAVVGTDQSMRALRVLNNLYLSEFLAVEYDFGFVKKVLFGIAPEFVVPVPVNPVTGALPTQVTVTVRGGRLASDSGGPSEPTRTFSNMSIADYAITNPAFRLSFAADCIKFTLASASSANVATFPCTDELPTSPNDLVEVVCGAGWNDGNNETFVSEILPPADEYASVYSAFFQHPNKEGPFGNWRFSNITTFGPDTPVAAALKYDVGSNGFWLELSTGQSLPPLQVTVAERRNGSDQFARCNGIQLFRYSGTDAAILPDDASCVDWQKAKRFVLTSIAGDGHKSHVFAAPPVVSTMQVPLLLSQTQFQQRVALERDWSPQWRVMAKPFDSTEPRPECSAQLTPDADLADDNPSIRVLGIDYVTSSAFLTTNRSDPRTHVNVVPNTANQPVLSFHLYTCEAPTSMRAFLSFYSQTKGAVLSVKTARRTNFTSSDPSSAFFMTPSTVATTIDSVPLWVLVEGAETIDDVTPGNFTPTLPAGTDQLYTQVVQETTTHQILHQFVVARSNTPEVSSAFYDPDLNGWKVVINNISSGNATDIRSIAASIDTLSVRVDWPKSLSEFVAGEYNDLEADMTVTRAVQEQRHGTALPMRDSLNLPETFAPSVLRTNLSITRIVPGGFNVKFENELDVEVFDNGEPGRLLNQPLTTLQVPSGVSASYLSPFMTLKFQNATGSTFCFGVQDGQARYMQYQDEVPKECLMRHLPMDSLVQGDAFRLVAFRGNDEEPLKAVLVNDELLIVTASYALKQGLSQFLQPATFRIFNDELLVEVRIKDLSQQAPYWHVLTRVLARKDLSYRADCLAMFSGVSANMDMLQLVKVDRGAPFGDACRRDCSAQRLVSEGVSFATIDAMPSLVPTAMCDVSCSMLAKLVLVPSSGAPASTLLKEQETHPSQCRNVFTMKESLGSIVLTWNRDAVGNSMTLENGEFVLDDPLERTQSQSAALSRVEIFDSQVQLVATQDMTPGRANRTVLDHNFAEVPGSDSDLSQPSFDMQLAPIFAKEGVTGPLFRLPAVMFEPHSNVSLASSTQISLLFSGDTVLLVDVLQGSVVFSADGPLVSDIVDKVVITVSFENAPEVTFKTPIEIRVVSASVLVAAQAVSNGVHPRYSGPFAFFDVDEGVRELMDQLPSDAFLRYTFLDMKTEQKYVGGRYLPLDATVLQQTAFPLYVQSASVEPTVINFDFETLTRLSVSMCGTSIAFDRNSLAEHSDTAEDHGFDPMHEISLQQQSVGIVGVTSSSNRPSVLPWETQYLNEAWNTKLQFQVVPRVRLTSSMSASPVLHDADTFALAWTDTRDADVTNMLPHTHMFVSVNNEVHGEIRSQSQWNSTDRFKDTVQFRLIRRVNGFSFVVLADDGSELGALGVNDLHDLVVTASVDVHWQVTTHAIKLCELDGQGGHPQHCAACNFLRFSATSSFFSSYPIPKLDCVLADSDVTQTLRLRLPATSQLAGFVGLSAGLDAMSEFGGYRLEYDDNTCIESDSMSRVECQSGNNSMLFRTDFAQATTSGVTMLPYALGQTVNFTDGSANNALNVVTEFESAPLLVPAGTSAQSLSQQRAALAGRLLFMPPVPLFALTKSMSSDSPVVPMPHPGSHLGNATAPSGFEFGLAGELMLREWSTPLKHGEYLVSDGAASAIVDNLGTYCIEWNTNSQTCTATAVKLPGTNGVRIVELPHCALSHQDAFISLQYQEVHTLTDDIMAEIRFDNDATATRVNLTRKIREQMAQGEMQLLAPSRHHYMALRLLSKRDGWQQPWNSLVVPAARVAFPRLEAFPLYAGWEMMQFDANRMYFVPRDEGTTLFESVLSQGKFGILLRPVVGNSGSTTTLLQDSGSAPSGEYLKFDESTQSWSLSTQEEATSFIWKNGGLHAILVERSDSVLPVVQSGDSVVVGDASLSEKALPVTPKRSDSTFRPTTSPPNQCNCVYGDCQPDGTCRCFVDFGQASQHLPETGWTGAQCDTCIGLLVRAPARSLCIPMDAPPRVREVSPNSQRFAGSDVEIVMENLPRFDKLASFGSIDSLGGQSSLPSSMHTFGINIAGQVVDSFVISDAVPATDFFFRSVRIRLHTPDLQFVRKNSSFNASPDGLDARVMTLFGSRQFDWKLFRPDLIYLIDECFGEGAFFDSDSGTCKTCPPNAVCPGGRRAYPKANFWSKSETSAPGECTIPDACPGAASETAIDAFTPDGARVTSGCSPAYDDGLRGTEDGTSTETEYCSRCAAGYYKNKNRCVKCGAGDGSVRALVLAGIVVFALLALAVLTLSSKLLDTVVAAVVTIQQLVLVLRAAADSMWQDDEKEGLRRFLRVISVVSLDVNFAQPDCLVGQLTYMDVFWGTLLAAVVVAAVFALMSFLRAMWKRFRITRRASVLMTFDDAIKRFFWPRLIRSLVILGWILYLKLTVRLFESLHCVSVPAGSNPDQTERRLHVDRTVQCFGTSHSPLFAVSLVLLLVYVIGFPVLAFRLARQAYIACSRVVAQTTAHMSDNKEARDRAFRDRGDRNVLERHGFLVRGLRMRWYWFRVAGLLVTLLLAFDNVFVMSATARLIVVGVVFVLNVLTVTAAWPFFKSYQNVLVFAVGSVQTLNVFIVLLAVGETAAALSVLGVVLVYMVATFACRRRMGWYRHGLNRRDQLRSEKHNESEPQSARDDDDAAQDSAVCIETLADGTDETCRNNVAELGEVERGQLAAVIDALEEVLAERRMRPSGGAFDDATYADTCEDESVPAPAEIEMQ